MAEVPPLRVVVGSKNPVKVAAVRKAFFQAFPDRVLVCVGHDVPSGVSDQPWGHAEKQQGAVQRARGARFMGDGEAHYAVGVEGGVVEVAGGGLKSIAYIAIFEGGGRVSVEHTASFALPPRVARLLKGEEPGHGKLELGAACDLVFNATNSKQQGGTVGALTRGLLDHTAYYEHALLCALAPFLHDGSGLYAAAAAPPARVPAARPPAPAPVPDGSPSPPAPPARPDAAAPPAFDGGDDCELVGVLSPDQRAAESRKRAEREGDVIDLADDDDEGAKRPKLSEEEKKNRALSIQEHMQLLKHAVSCPNAACPSGNCNKMKNHLRNLATCKTRVGGGCVTCRSTWALLQIHARQCTAPTGSCLVPNCTQLKAQLAQQAAAAAAAAGSAPAPTAATGPAPDTRDADRAPPRGERQAPGRRGTTSAAA